MYQSTKTYGHEVGMSCAFRQWRADSHCRLIHGYALAFYFVFQAEFLDYRNWVVDFGGLKPLKVALQKTFDHTLLVAEDDPDMDYICSLNGLGIANVIVVKRVGCEAFAEMAFTICNKVLMDMKAIPRVKLISAEVREHGANSAIYLPSDFIGAR